MEKNKNSSKKNKPLIGIIILSVLYFLSFIGSLISKHNDAYSYLPDSIDAFSTTKNLRDEMIKSGFKECFIRSYSFEISTLFIMRKV